MTAEPSPPATWPQFQRRRLTPALALAAVLALAGCEDNVSGSQAPFAPPAPATKAPRSAVLVVDLEAVLKGIGREESMRKELATARENLRGELTDFVAGLQTQIKTEREKLGVSPSTEEQEKFREFSAEASRRLQLAQGQAAQRARQIQIEMLNKFRDEVRPTADGIARQRGATAIVQSGTLVWFDPEADITAEIIEVMKSAQ